MVFNRLSCFRAVKVNGIILHSLWECLISIRHKLIVVGTELELALFSAYWQMLDYVYVGLQSVFAYDFTGKLFDSALWLKDNNYTVSYEIFIHVVYTVAGFELFVSVLYDSYLKEALTYLEVSDTTVRKYLASLDPTLFAIYHPEFGYVRRTGHTNALAQFGADFHFFIADNLQAYSLTLPVNLAIQFFVLGYVSFMFGAFFFSFFTSSSKEEGAADAEFAIGNVTIEAEKELFSAEDAKYLIIMFVSLFGMYFGFLAFSIGPIAGLVTMFLGLVPILMVAVLLVPLNLLFDFGLLFLLYLRGSSNTNSFFFELVYDYIGVIAFFTRLVVQFVRMALMFVVYCMMHDTVVLQKVAHWFLPAGDSFYDEVMNLRFTAHSISYFLVVALPCRLAYWTYEVVHTFFVVTAQFAAFFTIAFWLFLLFYTFYIYEKFEYHFKSLRITRRHMLEELRELNEARRLNK